MSLTPVISDDSDTPGALFRRLTMSSMWFSGLLALLLGFSWLFVLPRWSSVAIGNKEYSVAELQSYDMSLHASVLDLQQKRNALLVPADPTYAALRDGKQDAPLLATVLAQVVDQAHALSQKPDAVHIDRMEYVPATRTLVLTGDVRFVGTSSMTVLAQFTELLGKMSNISSLEQPTYARLQDPVTGPHSPFVISLSLR